MRRTRNNDQTNDNSHRSNIFNNPCGWKVIVFSAVLGAVVGGASTFLGSYVLEQHQQDDEQRAVAQAIIIDVHDTSQKINASLNDYNNYSSQSTNFSAFIDPTSYYQNNGIYFAYLTYIYKFDSKTSEDIFMYYSNVMQLEQQRQYIIGKNSDFFNGKNVTNNDNSTVYHYSTAMPQEINFTINRGKVVEKELEKNYNMDINLSKLDKIEVE